MSTIKISGESLPNIPWEEKPVDCSDVIWRYSKNPIIKRNPIPNIARIYNSAVLPFGDGFIGVFRCEHKNCSPRLHLGQSKDGIKWDIENEAINWVDEAGNPYFSAYAYDPRLVKIEDTYYIIFCTDFSGPVLGIVKTKDFKSFIRIENPFFPFNRNGVLFPRKIKGNYHLLSRPSDNGHTGFGDIFLSESPDMEYWGHHRKVMSAGGSGWWQAMKIGAGSVPIETDKGWLMFYHGAVNTCNGYVYSIGAALLDLENPSKVLYRSKDHLITPEEDYEVVGTVGNVCFPCATLFDSKTGRIAVYYGAADTYVAVAYTQIDELYENLKNNSELVWGDEKEWK